MGAIAAVSYLLLQLDVFSWDPLRSEVVDEPGSLAGALCFMLLQAVQFYWRTPRGLPDYYPLLGGIALAFSADRYLGAPRDFNTAFAFALLYGLLMALFYAMSVEHRDVRRARWRVQRYALTGLCTVLSIALAGGTAWGIRHGDRAIAQWMADRALMERLGLGNNLQSRLDSISGIKTRDQDRIALQITSERSPGYLRGQVYEEYNNDVWTALEPGSKAPERTEPLPGYTPQWRDERVYEVQSGASAIDDSMTVYPGPEIDRAIFAPSETGWIGRRGEVHVNGAGVMQSSGALNGEPYQVLLAPAAPASPLSSDERARFTQLPEDVDPRLKALANRICAGQEGNRDKADAVARYFQSQYAYELGIQIPRGQDPLAYFLFSDPLPAAHCEFFATGATLLLRAVGVPARYVTGVGVWEQHPFADYWVARNRDAHAWVEAWDDQRGWFLVEATPASGLPEAGGTQRSHLLGDLWSLISLHFRQLLSALRDGAWRRSVDILAALLAGLYLFVQEAWLPLVAILALIILLLRLLRRRKRRPTSSLPEGEIARRMHRQLQTMDAFVRRRHRLERSAHVTPHAFAREIERAVVGDEEPGRLARWYRAWADLRYQTSADPSALDALEAQVRAIRARKIRRPRG
jgi:transglutaminase-like putative cysteine protease